MTSAPADSQVIGNASQLAPGASPEPYPARLTLDTQIRRALQIRRILRFFAQLLMRKKRPVVWLANLIDAQTAIVKTLRYVAKREMAIKRLDKELREAETDERVQAVLAAFPGSELAVVRDMETP